MDVTNTSILESTIKPLENPQDLTGAGSLRVKDTDFLVSDLDKIYFRAIVQYGIQIVTQCFGVVTNIMNIVVFVKMGLTDSMTLTFFSLSVSDLLHLLTYLVYRVIPMMHFYFGIYTVLEPLRVPYPFSLYAIYFYDVSMYTTVFAAFQKCCCVTFPLKFKNTFTKKRTYITIATIFVVTLGIFLPVLAGLKFVYETNPRTNQTILSIKILKFYRTTEFYWQSAVKVALTPISQLIVIVCLIVMTKQLRASANFRTSSKAPKTILLSSKTNVLKTGDTSGEEILETGEKTGTGKQDTTSAPSTTRLSKNEIRAIRAVQLVCFVFVLTTLPPSIAYVIQSVYPPLNTPHMLNLKHVVYNSMYFLGTINASVNIFFYYKFNSNYKNTFRRVVVCGPFQSEKT